MVIVFLLGLGVLGYLPKSKRDLGLLFIEHFLHKFSLKFYFYEILHQLAKNLVSSIFCNSAPRYLTSINDENSNLPKNVKNGTKMEPNQDLRIFLRKAVITFC